MTKSATSSDEQPTTDEGAPNPEAEESTDAEKAPEDQQSEGTEEEDSADEDSEDESESEDGEDDELPEWARKKLTKANREAGNYRTQLREAQAELAKAKTVEEFEQATSTLNDRIVDLERQLVAEKYSLSPKIAKRLIGTSYEELENDAKDLAGELRAGDEEGLEGGTHPRGDYDEKVNPRENAIKYGRYGKR